jgi:outer membrane protein assembly factor BamB
MVRLVQGRSLREGARRWAVTIGAGAALLGAAAGCGEVVQQPTRTFNAVAGRDWGAPNADETNSRRMTGPIDAASVARLRPAWTVPLPTMPGAYTATPVIVDGVAYTQDMRSNVLAIDVRSGRVKWRKTYNQVDNGPNGVTVGDGRVYGATPKEVFALDATTGRQLWKLTIAPSEGEGIDMAPGFHEGTVFISNVPATGGVVSTLRALDAASGKLRWKWEQVPRSLWGHPEVNGGGGLWHPPAFDGAGGLYIGIANPVPWPGVPQAPWGLTRPGPNRWNNSIVKLDARTGRFLWGYQVLPHDIYDWDLECPIILARANGRRIALAAGKMGFVYAFDADRGTLLWKRSVGLHNGHDNDNLLAMNGQFERLRYGQRLLPGDWGGVQTQMASDGRTVYVPVNNLYSIFDGQQLPRQQNLMQGTGEVVAIDIATGRVRWDRKLPHSVYGAASIANDVVFTNTFDGTVWGLQLQTGKVIWKARLPAGSDSPVAIAGDTLLTGAGIPLGHGQKLAIVAYRLGAVPAAAGRARGSRDGKR